MFRTFKDCVSTYNQVAYIKTIHDRIVKTSKNYLGFLYWVSEWVELNADNIIDPEKYLVYIVVYKIAAQFWESYNGRGYTHLDEWQLCDGENNWPWYMSVK